MTRVADVMSDAVQSVSGDADVAEVRHLMQDLAVHALPVVESEALIGIVTSIDLADSVGESEPVTTIMSDSVHTVRPETEVAMAASFMRGLQVNHLVVADSDDRIVGIVSSWDLLETLAAAVRAHTVAGVDVAPVAEGDQLIVARPGEQVVRCRVIDVHGPGGLPPYVVVWDDDVERAPRTIDIVRDDDVTLDGCER